nr:hypothetical protein [Sulfurospirillum sp. 'SP']
MKKKMNFDSRLNLRISKEDYDLFIKITKHENKKYGEVLREYIKNYNKFYQIK